MLPEIANLWSEFSLVMKANPIVAGAVSLWGLAVLTYCLKFIPKVYYFIKSQCMTSLVMNNAGYSGNETQFKAFMTWYNDSPWRSWSRTMSLDGNLGWRAEGDAYVIGPGYGNHFFFYKYRLFWFNKSELNSQGSEKEKQQIVIKTLGRSQKPIYELIQDFAYVPKEDDMCIYVWRDNQWNMQTTVKRRPIESVVLKKEIKDSLVNNMQYFFDNREWYEKRGLAYKQTNVLHGVPGTGKSSTIKALASHFGRNICNIDMDMMSNMSFESAMATVPKNSIVLIEDFDSCSSTHSRTGANMALKAKGDLSSKVVSVSVDDGKPKPSEEQTPRSALADFASEFPQLTLSKILNVMDGVVSLDGTVIFLTTNHLEKIDSAVIRKGRVDNIFEIPYMEDTEIREYIGLMYGEVALPECTFAPTAGCDIQGLFLECRDNHEEFIDKLERV